MDELICNINKRKGRRRSKPEKKIKAFISNALKKNELPD
jgi:hypothetical protein